jgi:hypothetical protein
VRPTPPYHTTQARGKAHPQPSCSKGQVDHLNAYFRYSLHHLFASVWALAGQLARGPSLSAPMIPAGRAQDLPVYARLTKTGSGHHVGQLPAGPGMSTGPRPPPRRPLSLILHVATLTAVLWLSLRVMYGGGAARQDRGPGPCRRRPGRPRVACVLGAARTCCGSRAPEAQLAAARAPTARPPALLPLCHRAERTRHVLMLRRDVEPPRTCPPDAGLSTSSRLWGQQPQQQQQAHQLARAAKGGGEPSDAWCMQQTRAGSTAVFAAERCWQGGVPADACPPDARGAGRPRVLIASVALNNESFGLVRDHGLINKGPRGFAGFLDMLAAQVITPRGHPCPALDARAVLPSVCVLHQRGSRRPASSCCVQRQLISVIEKRH